MAFPVPGRMTQARSGIARSGYTRSNYFQPFLWPAIGGTSLVPYLVKDTMLIEDVLSTQANICRFSVYGYKPSFNSEVQIGYGSADNLYFGGYITSWNEKRVTRGAVQNPTINLGAVPLSSLKLATVSGMAFVQIDGLDLMPYVGKYLILTDSAGKKLGGYAASRGGDLSPMLFGGELLKDTDFSLQDGSWMIQDASITFEVVGGGPEQRAYFNATPPQEGLLQIDVVPGDADGRLFRMGFTVEGFSAGAIHMRMTTTPFTDSRDYAANGTVVEYVCGAGPSGGVNNVAVQTHDTGANSTLYIRNVSLMEALSPDPTGVWIRTTLTGGVDAWTVEDVGFNRHDLNGYTLTASDGPVPPPLAAIGTARFIYDIEAVGFEKDFSEAIIDNREFTNVTAGSIIQTLVAERFGSRFGISFVQNGPVIPYIYFDHLSLSDVLRRLAMMTGYYWDILPDKNVRFFSVLSHPSSLVIGAGKYNYDEMQISQDISQLRNKVYVRGAQLLSDSVTYNRLGDGTSRYWVLPYGPVGLTLAVGGTNKTVGVDNIADEGAAQFFMNYSAKTIRCSASEPTPAVNVTLALTFQYYKPAMAIVTNPVSISTYGTREHLIEDWSVLDMATAVLIGQADLASYSDPIERGSFSTWSQNLYIGDSVPINLVDRNFNKHVLVQKVTRKVRGRRWDVLAEFTTAKLDYQDLLQKVNFLAERSRAPSVERQSEMIGTQVIFTP